MAEVLTPTDPNFAAQIREGDRTAIQTAVEAYLGQILRAARGVPASRLKRQRTSHRRRSRPLLSRLHASKGGPASGPGCLASCTRRSPKRAGPGSVTGSTKRSTRPSSVGSTPAGSGARLPGRSTPPFTRSKSKLRSSTALMRRRSGNRWLSSSGRLSSSQLRTSVMS